MTSSESFWKVNNRLWEAGQVGSSTPVCLEEGERKDKEGEIPSGWLHQLGVLEAGTEALELEAAVSVVCFE